MIMLVAASSLDRGNRRAAVLAVECLRLLDSPVHALRPAYLHCSKA